MFRNKGKCRYKEQCRFEHSVGEPIPVVIKPRGVCHLFRDEGECTYGANCRYFHGTEAEAEEDAELRKANQAEGKVAPKKKRKKTKKKKNADRMCDNFTESGECDYGDDCRFQHGPDDTRDLDGLRKTLRGPCFTFRDTGDCKYGAECRFLHESA